MHSGAPDACVGRGCNVADCRSMSKSDTTLSGTVFAPNGTLPLSGIQVYVPALDPGALTEGATCAKCTDPLPGSPVVQAITDANGNFSLSGVPSGDDVPLVITSGKWRKIVKLPHIADCTSTTMTPAETTLPRNRSEGDMPQIAITTGGADSLECLVRKLGIDDKEITTDTATPSGKVHLYQSNFGKTHFTTGSTFTQAEDLWTNLPKMKQYDILFFSCEGAQYPANKPQAALDAVKAYADFGGRVFATHWHNIWLEGSVEQHDQGYTQTQAKSWTDLATWTNREESELPKDSYALIDETSNPKGEAFANWMLANHGSTVADRIDLQNQPPDGNVVLSTGRSSLDKSDPAKTERWVYLPQSITNGATQNFQFTTPIEAGALDRCGKFVFSDMHVSGTTDTVGGYPDSCGSSLDMTPQEKALAFMFFDIASCVGVIF